jgi:hypothetical protein
MRHAYEARFDMRGNLENFWFLSDRIVVRLIVDEKDTWGRSLKAEANINRVDSTLGSPPEHVSPAADPLHPLAAPQSGEETALGRAPPEAQRPRESRPAPARRPLSAAPVSPRPSLLSY